MSVMVGRLTAPPTNFPMQLRHFWMRSRDCIASGSAQTSNRENRTHSKCRYALTVQPYTCTCIQVCMYVCICVYNTVCNRASEVTGQRGHNSIKNRGIQVLVEKWNCQIENGSRKFVCFQILSWAGSCSLPSTFYKFVWNSPSSYHDHYYENL